MKTKSIFVVVVTSSMACLLVSCNRGDTTALKSPDQSVGAASSGEAGRYQNKIGPDGGWFGRRLRLGARYYNATWALIVGIDNYPGKSSGFDPLLYAANDAAELRNVLQNDFGYREDHIHFLKNASATGERLRREIETWPPRNKLKKSDAFSFFFAGHGLTNDRSREGYLAASDSQRKDLGTAVPVSRVRDTLAQLPCRHRLLILDSCYSGSLFLEKPTGAVSDGPQGTAAKERQRSGTATPSRGSTGSDPPTDEFAHYLHEPFFWGMSAGLYQPVYDGQGKDRHSVFTAALLKVLGERADSGRSDHAFTFRQLASQVEVRVRDAHIGQIPDWRPLGPGSGDFVFLPTVLAGRREKNPWIANCSPGAAGTPLR